MGIKRLDSMRLLFIVVINILFCLSMHPQGNKKKENIVISELPTLINSTDDLENWSIRRGEILRLLQENEYGVIPENNCIKYNYKLITSISDNDLKRKEVDIIISKGLDTCTLHLLMYVPKKIKRPAVLLGINSMGNHTVTDDKDVIQQLGYDSRRGCDAVNWNISETLKNNIAFATFCCKDICDDNMNGPITKIGKMLYGEQRDSVSCGFLGIQAWGMTVVLNYLKNDKDVDASRVIPFGHSRYGKIALWAAAQDDRFAGVIASSSGSGGASLYRNNNKETPYDICKRFPYWMCKNFLKYSDNDVYLPIDQHMVLSLLAPRPMYISNSDRDAYVSPIFEYASLLEVLPIYDFYGYGIDYGKKIPLIEQPIYQRIGYHIKRGVHSVTKYDWECYYHWISRYFENSK